jgi:transposase
MTAYGTEFFSMNDVNRLRILQDVIDRRLTTRLAATRLEISDRHCRRLLERYREHGPLSLVNRRRGQPATGSSCRASLNGTAYYSRTLR